MVAFIEELSLGISSDRDSTPHTVRQSSLTEGWLSILEVQKKTVLGCQFPTGGGSTPALQWFNGLINCPWNPAQANHIEHLSVSRSCPDLIVWILFWKVFSSSGFRSITISLERWPCEIRPAFDSLLNRAHPDLPRIRCLNCGWLRVALAEQMNSNQATLCFIPYSKVPWRNETAGFEKKALRHVKTRWPNRPSLNYSFLWSELYILSRVSQTFLIDIWRKPV